MACSGCSGAVERVLKKTPGIQSVESDLDTQRVIVETDGSIGKEKVLELVAKTGKACELV